MDKIPNHPGDQITDPRLYFSRRALMKAGMGVASVAATAGVYRFFNHPPSRSRVEAFLPEGDAVAPQTQPDGGPMRAATGAGKPPWYTNEPETSYEQITHWNNYYEFSTDKEEVADAAEDFTTAGWKLSVGGLVSKPTVFDMDDLLKIAPIEERVYRMRCVEAWSMVIPWNGYPLRALLDRVQPLSGAKYVAFETLADGNKMPNLSSGVLPWPYVEGLRMDEAMHPLAILATGLYGRYLPPQDGAPIRLVTPWKYGFKGAKSLVKITLTDEQPPTTWNKMAPEEYGFYANVNPNVDHPRWSQATEQRIGGDRIPTLMFNGYADLVGNLYSGMDLREYF